MKNGDLVILKSLEDFPEDVGIISDHNDRAGSAADWVSIKFPWADDGIHSAEMRRNTLRPLKAHEVAQLRKSGLLNRIHK